MTTLRDIHEYVVQNLLGDANEEVSHLALGDDDTEPSVSDTGLGNEVARFTITDTFDEGEDLRTQTFITSEDANGEHLLELSLGTDENPAESLHLNRSLIADPEGRLDPKTGAVQAMLTVTLRFRDESEVA